MEKIARNMLVFTALILPLAQVNVRVFNVPVYVPELFILFALTIFLTGVAKKMIIPTPIPRSILFGIMLFLFGAVVSSLSAGMDNRELGAIKSWVIFPITYGLLISQLVKTNRHRMMIIGCWYAGIIAIAVLSLFPFPFIRETYDHRLASVYPSPNHLAMFCDPGVLIGLYLSFTFFASRRFLKAFLAMIGIVPIFAVLVLTASGGGMMASGVGTILLLAFVLFPKKVTIRSMSIVIGVLLLCATLFLSMPNPNDLAGGLVRTSFGSRVMIWNASLQILRQHPILGIGFRTFEREYLLLQSEFPPYLEWAVPHPHNIVLAAWLFTGLFGFLGLFVTIVSVFQRLVATIYGSDDISVRMEAICFLSFLSAFLVHGLVDVPFFRNDLSLQFFLVIGLSVSALRSIDHRK